MSGANIAEDMKLSLWASYYRAEWHGSGQIPTRAVRSGLIDRFGAVPIVAIESDLGEPINEARIRKVLPKFHAVTLPGTGHFLMMEDPQRFNPALDAEVTALLGSPGS